MAPEGDGVFWGLGLATKNGYKIRAWLSVQVNAFAGRDRCSDASEGSDLPALPGVGPPRLQTFAESLLQMCD